MSLVFCLIFPLRFLLISSILGCNTLPLLLLIPFICTVCHPMTLINNMAWVFLAFWILHVHYAVLFLAFFCNPFFKTKIFSITRLFEDLLPCLFSQHCMFPVLVSFLFSISRVYGRRKWIAISLFFFSFFFFFSFQVASMRGIDMTELFYILYCIHLSSTSHIYPSVMACIFLPPRHCLTYLHTLSAPFMFSSSPTFMYTRPNLRLRLSFHPYIPWQRLGQVSLSFVEFVCLCNSLFLVFKNRI